MRGRRRTPRSVKDDASIRVTHVRYHRNGVGGNGFHVVNFRWERKDMVGVVFEEPGNVAVIHPPSPGECFRGDYFEDELRAAVKEYEDQRS